MVFNSFSFAIFFALVFGLFQAARKSWSAQKCLLVVASYLFYAAWNPPLVTLLFVSTIVDWTAARLMVRAKNNRRR